MMKQSLNKQLKLDRFSLQTIDFSFLSYYWYLKLHFELSVFLRPDYHYYYYFKWSHEKSIEILLLVVVVQQNKTSRCGRQKQEHE
jgi:hypothetical protein